MSAPWLTLRTAKEERRVPLDRAVLRLGAGGADVPIAGVDSGQLHVWSQPPKVVRVGGGPELVVAGRRVDEAMLEPGTTAVWGPLTLSLDGGARVLEELPSDEPVRGAGGGDRRGLGPNAARAHDRLVAGILVELGLAPKDAAKRWQASVVKGEWDADACAREVLDQGAVTSEDPRVLERAGRLQRDLVMASFQRGLRKAGRNMRGMARQGSAILIANVVAFLCYSLILLAVAVLLRVRWEWSFDDLIDRGLALFR